MAKAAVSFNPTSSVHTRALIVPREHGAWGMLLVPLVTGAAVGTGRGGDYLAVLLFTIAAVSLFWLRTPVEGLLGTSAMRVRDAEERRVVVVGISIISSIAGFAVTVLLWNRHRLGLVAIGGCAGAAFVAQVLLKKRGRSYRGLAQVIGSIGLTSTAASAYYLVSGRIDSTALALWTANWLFAAEQVEFVQLRIQGARLGDARARFQRGKTYLVTFSAIVLTIALLSIGRFIPALALVAFAPAILRSGVWFYSPPRSLDVHRLGWSELANATVFASVLAVMFRIG